MNKKLLLATNNLGKFEEMKFLLAGLKLSLLKPEDMPSHEKIIIVETGKTYRANAKLKAETIGKLAQLPTLADDSGLEVLALAGFPGLMSARWYQGTDADRNQALLAKMRHVEDRRARYVAVVCLYLPQNNQFIYSQGELQGRIALKPTGAAVSGFGYDPIFIPQGYNHSLAELGDDVKLKISHRTQAMEKIAASLEKYVVSSS